MTDNIKKIIACAFMCGYEKGHFDTVEGIYGYIEDKADDYLAELETEIFKKKGG